MPFSLSDMSQIEEKLGSFSKNPTKYRKEFLRLTQAYNLTWSDIYYILQILHAFFLNPQLAFSPFAPINPASVLPTPSTAGLPLHNCSLTVGLTQNPFQHSTDQPILDPNTPYWFIDGSSQNPHPSQQDMPSSRETFITIMGNR